MCGVLDCGNQGEGNLRCGFEAGTVGRRRSSQCSAELGAKLERIERIENVLWREEFRGAASEFGTEDRDTRENRFAGNKSPRIFKSRENQEIRRAVNAQHVLGRLRGLE